MLSFSIPIWISSLSLAPVATLTLVILARAPGGEYQLGLFNTANGLRMLIVILPSVIATVVAPALIQEGGAKGNEEAFGSLLNKSFSALALTVIPLLILCLFLSDLLLSIYGKAYAGSFRLFMPLVAAAGVGALGAPLVTVMMAKNKTWWSLFFGLVKSLFLLLLCWLWVPTHLAMGLAWAFTISEVFFYLVTLEFCIRSGTLSTSIRSEFYSSTIAIGVLLMFALWLPDVVRWLSAIPLTAAVVIFILRTHRDLAKTLPNMVPTILQPSAQHLLSLIAN
jgi:O-antigen/teichoic acid export membrane protein